MSLLHIAAGYPLITDPVRLDALLLSLRRRLPDVVRCTLMPDHLHALGSEATFVALKRVAVADRSRGVLAWAPVERPVVVPPGQKREFAIRYVDLNPVRSKLVTDPLTWRWSTYADALGLTLKPWTPPSVWQPHVHRSLRRPERWHRFTSNDSCATVGGTPFPSPARLVSYGNEPWEQLVGVVERVAVWCAAKDQRRLLAQFAASRGHRRADIAAWGQVSERTVTRALARPHDADAAQRLLTALADERLRDGRRLSTQALQRLAPPW